MAEKISNKFGLPPGAPVYVGDQEDGQFKVLGLAVGQQGVTEARLSTVEDAVRFLQPERVNLLVIQGLQAAEKIADLGGRLGLHPLIVEDILNSEGHPKIQFEFDYVYLVLRLFHQVDGEIEGENISLVLGETYVAVFLEQDHREFEVIGKRMRLKNSRILEFGPSYLTFALLDYWVDHYFPLLENLDEEIWALEDTLFAELDESVLQNVHRLRKVAMELRRFARPCLDLANQLLHTDHNLINDATDPFYRDLHDHLVQVLDMAEANMELLMNLQSQFVALSAQRTNEVMKFLTMMGSIFIPLTFIVGIYGMNFEYFPELHWKYGYFGIMGFMTLVALGLLGYFRKRKWF